MRLDPQSQQVLALFRQSIHSALCDLAANTGRQTKLSLNLKVEYAEFTHTITMKFDTGKVSEDETEPGLDFEHER